MLNECRWVEIAVSCEEHTHTARGEGNWLAGSYRRDTTALRRALDKCITLYKGSAWVPACAGTHASGRAEQHFELFDSILGRVKKVTTHNHNLPVQYVR